MHHYPSFDFIFPSNSFIHSYHIQKLAIYEIPRVTILHVSKSEIPIQQVIQRNEQTMITIPL